MKILYVTNIPTPYRVAYFNELGKKCELTVVFEKRNSAERDVSWREYIFENFKGVFLRGISVRAEAIIGPGVVKYLRKSRYDYIVVTNISSPTGLLAIAWMKIRKIPYCIEGDGGFAEKRKGFKASLKKWIISTASICFSTGKMHDEYYLTYGATKKSICRYPFSSIGEKEILPARLKSEQKKQFKKEVGIVEEKAILAVGKFIHRKGFDLLIKAAVFIPKDWGVYLIGGEATEEYLSLKEDLELSNLHFVGFKKPHELKQFFCAADFFVFPTRKDIWGLVVNEAMAYALPVITTNRCVAGLELIRNGVNGQIVKSGSVEDLKNAMLRYINSDNYLEQCSDSALQVIHEYTIEKMASAHIIRWENE